MDGKKLVSITFDEAITMTPGDTLNFTIDYINDVVGSFLNTEDKKATITNKVSTKTYVGIGSRNTPVVIQAFMRFLGYKLAREGWTLRSGGAPGADSAFEEGCDIAQGTKEIFLPWPGFNGKVSSFDLVIEEDFEIAEKYHPNWKRCSPAAKKLHARNVRQILGKNPAQKPVLPAFVVCWTKNGKDVGGTSQALRIARDHNVPIFNIGYKGLDVSSDWTPIFALNDLLKCNLLLEFEEWRK